MKNYILTFLTSVKVDLVDTYKRSKIFLLAIAGLILALEFNKLKEILLVYMGQKQIKQTEAKDDALKTQETNLNTEANQLEQQAQALPSTQKPVTDPNWYKK